MARNMRKVGQRYYLNPMTNLLFSHEQLLAERFLQTDLGQLYQSIPFDQLAHTLPILKTCSAITGIPFI